MKKNIIQIWKAKGHIFEGIKNSIFKKEDVEQIAAYRHEICVSNKCGKYDPEGKSENAYFPGQETCGACGCKMAWKIRALSNACGLNTIGREPLWHAEITEEEEAKLKEKIDY